MNEPKWLEWARTQIGTAEVPGPGDNPKIVKYFQLCGLTGAPFLDDETPWCAAFVGAALSQTGLSGTHSPAAMSYLKWSLGVDVKFPVLGAIAVLRRDPPKPGLGHVGFVVGADENFVALLGGNQGDKVSIAKFARSRVVKFMWPKNDLVPAAWTNPPIDPKTVAGTKVV
jgi:uncharacterized protein (TIGR02594 family)